MISSERVANEVFVPLQSVERRFGDLTGTLPEAPSSPGGGFVPRTKNEALLPAALLRSVSRQSAAQPKPAQTLTQEEIIHADCMHQLTEFRDAVEVELDLTWRSLQAAISEHAADNADWYGRANQEEDLIVQLELQRSATGGARSYGLLMRTPPAWEAHALEDLPEKKVATWTSRPSSPRKNLRRPATARTGTKASSSSWTSTSGDKGTQQASVASSKGQQSAFVKVSDAEIAKRVLIRRSRAAPDSVAEGGSDVRDLVPWCPLPGPKGRGGSQQRAPGFHGKWTNLAEVVTSRLTDVSKLEGDSEVDMQALAQHSLRDLREIIRLLGQELPSAAQLCEAAVKVLVISLDGLAAARRREVERAAEEMRFQSGLNLHVQAMEHEANEARQECERLQERMLAMERRMTSEARALAEKLRIAQEEVQRLTPDPQKMKHVSGLMGDYQVLMHQMEDECRKQTKILLNMARYTRDVIHDASGDPRRGRRQENGRLVELQNGEIMLRPYDTADGFVQVTEADLCVIDYDGPLKFRSLGSRQLLNMFTSLPTPTMSMEELSKEIDKIYSAKMIADNECDKLGLRHTELLDFLIGHYLPESPSLREAERQVCGILRSIVRARPTLPAKVALFARFLEFCEDQRPLPCSALDVILQAKRLMQAKGSRGLLNSGVRMVKFRADSDEPLLSIAATYDTAVKALPSGSIPALRELFTSLARRSEQDSTVGASMGGSDTRHSHQASRYSGSRELLVLLLLLHDRLHREVAPKLRDLIAKAEGRGTVTGEEMRDAILDAGILGVTEATWRAGLSPGFTGSNSEVSGELLLEYLGGGSAARLPKIGIRETPFLETVADALIADYDDRLMPIERVWDRNFDGEAVPMPFVDFKQMVMSVEPSIATSLLKQWYIATAEASRSCTQVSGEAPPIAGTLEPIQGRYGGDLLNWRVLWHGALRHRLFLPDGYVGPQQPVNSYSSQAASPPTSPSGRSNRASVRSCGTFILPSLGKA